MLKYEVWRIEVEAMSTIVAHTYVRNEEGIRTLWFSQSSRHITAPWARTTHNLASISAQMSNLRASLADVEWCIEVKAKTNHFYTHMLDIRWEVLEQSHNTLIAWQYLLCLRSELEPIRVCPAFLNKYHQISGYHLRRKNGALRRKQMPTAVTHTWCKFNKGIEIVLQFPYGSTVPSTPLL